MDTVHIPVTPLSPSHPIVVTAINGGLQLQETNVEQIHMNCVIPPYVPVFIKRNQSLDATLPLVVANTTSLKDTEYVFFGISFTSTIMV